MFLFLQWCVLVLIGLINNIHFIHAYNQVDEASYMANFGHIIANSYSHPLPSQLLTSTCKTKVGISGVTRTLGGGTISATQAQSVCSIDSTCIIPAGTTLLMDNSLVVGALINRGTIQWTDSTQSSQHQWLCAGYVVTEGGTFTLDLQNNAKNAYLYIKNNGATHPILRSRSFGGSDGARIRILGSPLIRTWSLLSRPITIGSSTITLMHDINSMGWKIGDRIIIAPTTVGSSGRAEAYRIAGINANTITLGQLTSSATATTQQSFKSNTSYIDSASAWTTIMAAEVIHMSRNIIITGDDFQHRGCRTDITNPADDCKCMPNMGRTQCTLGLHTVLVGTGGLLQLQYTRVEKCGQRGILGKYCVHTHLSAQCPDCIIRGNSIEYGHQRGIVIHGTHLSTIEHNVMSDVRGANIYIEDGNEMYNRILYNIALCPWPLSDPYLQGCTIPGTDNDQSDTTINQAGIWALSFSNDIIGNRMINSYNGMLYQAQGYEKGRDETQGQICPNNQQIGRLEGNTFHGHGRFGTYILSSIYPKAVTQVRTLNNNGLLPDNDFSACAAATSDGNDRGMMVSFYRNIDYGNTFVGQYNMGDIQYVDHTSIECNNLIYWKETKNPVDGCSSYYLNGYFEGSSSVPGTVALPSGHGTVVLENIVLAGMIILESSHHCQEGWTGVLCMPTYVFHKVRAPVKDVRISYAWGKNNGAMYTLSPDDPTNAGGNLFPIGYVSLANPFWSYLLALDGGRTCFTSSSVASSLGEDVNAFTTRYGRGILCKRPLRRLEIWTPKLTTSMNPPNLRLELIQNNIMISYVIVPFFQISGGELGKQGYAITVIPGTTHSYRLMREDKGPIDNNWVIEFSDTIFGNRWPRDEILLTVVGRSCPSPVHSLHDRRFIWYDSDNHPFQAGRGACTSQPDMPAKNCQNLVPAPIGTACPEKCPGGCNNGYCDCGRGVCQCNAGFYGPNCAQDVCASSFVCNPSYGRCTARYLGGTLPPVENMCACKQNIFGPYCDIDPCAGQTCSGHGKCKVLSQTSIACICDAGWNGGACSLPCSGSSCEPACFSGFQYYTDTNLETNIYDRQYSEDAETCGQQCTADGTRCVAALFYNGNYCGKMSALSGTRTSFTGRILLQRCSTTSTPPPAAGYGSNPGTPNIPVVINPPPPVTQPPVIVTQPPVIATQPPVIATQPPPVISTPPPPVTITNPPPSTSASTASITFNAYDDTYTISGVINGDRVTLSLACVDTKVRLTSIQFMIAFSSTVPMTDISQPGCTTTGFASTLSCSMTYKPLPLYLYVMWNIQGVPYRMQHPLPQAGTSPFVTLQFSTSTTVATTPPTQAPVPVTQAPVPVTQAPVPVTQPPPVPVTQAPPIPSGSNVARIPFTAYDSSYTLTGTLNSACTSVTLSLTSSSKTLTSVIFMVAYSTSIPMNDISQPGCQTSGSSSTLSCTVTVPYQRIPLYIYVMWNVIGVPYRMQQPLPQAGVSPFLPGMNLVCTGGAAGTQDDDDDDEDTATLPPPVTDSGVCRDCSVVETGWDYMGMDLGKKPIAANHHSECCSICSNTKGCHAYSYYDGYCYLKSTSAGRVRRIGSTSSTICTASEQIGYQDTSITYDVTIASCLNDNTCQQIHGKLSQCIRSREKGATGYCHCRKDAVISGSGQCIRASPCGVCPSIPDCPIGRYPVVKKAASPDYGRCCHQYKCERMGGPAAAGIQMLPEDEMFEDESTITETSSSRMKSMMIPIAIIASIILFAVLGVLTWSKYRKHQSPFSFKFQLHRDQHDDQEQGNVPITHFDTSNTSSSEFPQGALSPSPIHHFSLSSLTTSTSNSSISDSYVPASPATLWNMSRMQRSDSTDVTSDTNLTSIPEFPQGHFSISRRHQKSRAASPEPNPAPAPDEESPESHNNE